MSKKKLVALISVSFAAVFMICSAMVFTACMTAEDFRNTTDKIYDNIEYVILRYEKKYQTEKEIEENLNELLSDATRSYDRYPYIFALIEPETGEIAAQSASYISFKKDLYDEWTYINMEPYLTPEIKKQLTKYRDSVKAKMFYIYRMSFNVSSGEYIPVEMDIGFYDLYEKKTIRFTDYEPQLEITEKSEFCLFNYVFYDLNENHFNHKYYGELEEFVKEVAAEVKAGEHLDGGGGFKGNDKVYYRGIDHINKKEYVTCFAAVHSPYYDTLTKTAFGHIEFMLLLIFILIYVIFVLAASKLYDKNQRLNQSLRAFTSAAAHELKTPLAVIQNQCECIIENIAPQKNEEYIKSVYDEAVRMNAIVTNLLQYNRLVNAEKLQKEKCDLKEIVIEETEKYRTFAVTSGAEMQLEVSTEESVVMCNRDLISMAVDNYLSNAIKYAKGEKKIFVRLKGNRLSVYNTCDGLSEETSKEMWNVFSKENKARTKDGTSTGLGLPICAEIFRAHGFDYGFRNVKDGVEFYFSAK